MKKKTIIKKAISFTLAAMMTLTVYMPTAAFATESPENAAGEAAAAQAAEETTTTASKQATRESQAAEETTTATSKQATRESQAAEETATATSEQATRESQTTEETTPEESKQAVQESQYGEKTGNWGYGNDTKTTKWEEYANGNERILVFSSTHASDSDEENAVTQILDQDGKSVKNQLKNTVTQVVFETGITGIGWTALYSNSGYEPVYNSADYTIDPSKTDVFKDFAKLTTVVPCETIKKIGWSAFRKCYNLKNFDFTKCPELETIMNQAFNECKSLNNVDLSNCNALETIAWSAFNGAGKGSDAKLTLPTSGVLSIIGGYAFYQYANKNANGTEVDFTGVASSVTQVLQKAFEGSNVIGEMIGFKNLETLANNALRNSKITYVPYDPSQDEDSSTEEQVVSVEEPVVSVEEPIIGAEEQTDDSENNNTADAEPLVTAEDILVPSIEGGTSPAAAVETAASAAVAAVTGAATAAAEKASETVSGKATVNSATLTSIKDSAVPAAAPAADTVSISDADVPMAASQADSSMGLILGGLASALLLALAAMREIGRRRVFSTK